MTSDRRRFLIQLTALLIACGGPSIPSGGETVQGASDSTFHTIYDDPVRRARFKGFFEQVFRLYPPEALHKLVEQSTRTHATDAEIYAAIVAGLPAISPRARMLRLALPALKKQKQVMAAQASRLLGTPQRVDGYLEIGTTGRYYNAIKSLVPLEGPTWVLNDRKPSKDPADIVERGQLSEVGSFIALDDYAPVATDVADNSLDLVSNFIGFHHAPPPKLHGFIDGIRRVLRPGGTLLLREHDVVDPTMNAVVTLAHAVFNAGTQVDWSTNTQEVRAFRSVAQWKQLLAARGFQHRGAPETQVGDPTNNKLLVFQKV